MIEIEPDEAKQLEKTFQYFTDREIIRELVRRKRLRQTEASALFYPEMRGDDNYMDNIREHVLRRLAHNIANTHDIRPMLIGERPAPSRIACSGDVTRPSAPGEAVMTADIVYLVARDKKEG